MTIKKRLIMITTAFVAAVVAICVIVFGNSNPANSDTIAPETKKIQLQEQLAVELQKYYLGEDNYEVCQQLIEEIEQYK